MYRLSWAWDAPVADPFSYGRGLMRAWIRAEVSTRSIRVGACQTGRITVTIEVEAADLQTAITGWADFAWRAVRERGLVPPTSANLAVSEA